MAWIQSLARRLGVAAGVAAVCAVAVIAIFAAVEIFGHSGGPKIPNRYVVAYLHAKIEGATWIECDDLDETPGSHVDCTVTLASVPRRARVTLVSVDRGRSVSFAQYTWAWLDEAERGDER